MISVVRGSEQRWRKGGVSWVKAIFLSIDTPASLEISGGDVEGLSEGEVISIGSVLITPTANYIAFEDGVFTQKG